MNHCSLPNVASTGEEWFSEEDDVSGGVDVRLTNQFIGEEATSSSIRPGIVHRLDKGTSGLLVVAKVRLYSVFIY